MDISCYYKEICPAYDKYREKCSSNSDCKITYGNENCIPMLLEAYHAEKGTPWEKIHNYLGFGGPEILNDE